ncbi:MAG: hypothetical protein ACO3LG_11485, partial [Ilumatobacteraceae bacterium]
AGGLTWAPIDFQARRDTSSTHWCPLIVNGGALFCWGQPPEGRAALDLATLSLPIDQGMFPRIVDVSLDAVTTCTVTVGATDAEKHRISYGVSQSYNSLTARASGETISRTFNIEPDQTLTWAGYAVDELGASTRFTINFTLKASGSLTTAPYTCSIVK